MSNRRKFQILIDMAMTVMLPVLMAYSLVGEEPHEWVGVAMFTAFVIHNVLNRQWHKGLTRGKYNAVRKTQVVVNLALFVLIMAMMLSGIAMSRHVFTFLPFDFSISLARLVHLAAAYWFYVMTSVHLGLHWTTMMGIPKKMFKLKRSQTRKNVLRVIALVIAGIGLYEFVTRNFLLYMFLRTEFVFIDFSEPLWHFFLSYFAIMGLFVAVGHYGLLLIKKIPNKKRKPAARKVVD
ncbi:DUF4405 domain-containing protein [Enterococcus sp. 669A]|uniref:DUF4405 domain-containing protein n=1 Tax=Candidatus Enterococcus moelleringii TaxID=2815325 RepID=A0ABS3LBZ3_9ENTE|nr:DUF4405 domain-containing protein [Enterococcus sp. 669A]MBO1307153.1 DUF4405 domain-containing protein [Enterococcus sp. 669A]